jgi:hypothetical protein
MKQMGKGKKGDEENPSEELGPKQIIYRIISLHINKDATDEQRYELWEAAQKIFARSNPPDSEPSDEQGT